MQRSTMEGGGAQPSPHRGRPTGPLRCYGCCIWVDRRAHHVCSLVCWCAARRCIAGSTAGRGLLRAVPNSLDDPPHCAGTHVWSSWRLGEGEVACGAGGWKRAGAEHMGCGGQAARTHRHGPAERWRAARGRTGTGGPGGRHRTAPALTGRRLRSAALRANTAATGREQSRCRKLLAVHDGKCTCTCRAAACRCAGRRRGAGAGGTWQQNAWAQFVSTASPSQSRQTGQLSSSSAGEAAAMLRDCGVSQVFVRSSTRTRTTTHLN